MAISDFLIYLKTEKRYSDNTIKAYKNDLAQFEEYILSESGHFVLKDITSFEIRQWVMLLMFDEKSATSVGRKLSALRSFFKYLRRQGLVSKNPVVAITAPKKSKRLPVFVKEAEMNKLLDEIPFPDGIIGCRDRLILELLYHTGLRVSEVAGLRSTQIDFDTKAIRVIGKRGKERLVPLTNPLFISIGKYAELKEKEFVSHDPCFFITDKGKPVYEKLIYRVVNKYLGLVTTVSKKSPHVLRHSFASVLLNKGADINVIKELLGHSNIAATEVYTHSTFKDLSKAYKLAHPRA